MKKIIGSIGKIGASLLFVYLLFMGVSLMFGYSVHDVNYNLFKAPFEWLYLERCEEPKYPIELEDEKIKVKETSIISLCEAIDFNQIKYSLKVADGEKVIAEITKMDLKGNEFIQKWEYNMSSYDHIIMNDDDGNTVVAVKLIKANDEGETILFENQYKEC